MTMAGLIKGHEILIIIVLAILLVIAIVISIYLYYVLSADKTQIIGVSNTVSKKKPNEDKAIHKKHSADYANMNIKYNLIRNDYENACIQINDLKSKIEKLKFDNSELQRKCDELSHLTERNPSECIFVPKESYRTDIPYKSEPTKQEERLSISSEYVTMYASMARQVDNRAYFSDISDNIKDDSYFVLTIHKSSETATYKPLDFMKIRGYDPVMSAIRTEGAKPHAATAVLSIEPGEAHLEGKDWFIDKYTTIKLA